jgi:hypothetical protein
MDAAKRSYNLDLLVQLTDRKGQKVSNRSILHANDADRSESRRSNSRQSSLIDQGWSSISQVNCIRAMQQHDHGSDNKACLLDIANNQDPVAQRLPQTEIVSALDQFTGFYFRAFQQPTKTTNSTEAADISLYNRLHERLAQNFTNI